MGFHINVYNMQRLETYAMAKKYFANTTAVRGEAKSMRRLGDRYEKAKWIRQEMQEGIEVYIAGYYDTDLVRFYPTHKEITLGGCPSISTKYFVEYVGRVGLNPFEHKRYVPAPFTRSPMVKNHQIECSINNMSRNYFMNADTWYKLDYDNKPLDESQFETPFKYKFDVSQMRELRLPYKTLLKYIDTMLKLNNEGVETDEVLDNQVREWEGNKLHFLAQESNMYLAYYHLSRQTQHLRWSGNKHVYYSNIAMIKRYLDRLIKLSNPQVLVEVKPTNNLTT